MPESELTDRAKKEIFIYIIKLAIPSVAVIGIILSLFTYLVQDVIGTKTKMEVYDKANTRIQDLLIQVADAKSQADTAKQKIIDTESEASSLKSRIETAETDINNLLQKSRQHSKLIDSEKTVSEIAKKVIEIPGFLSQIKTSNEIPVGTVVSSLIKPSNFIKGPLIGLWVPADGRPIPKDSKYFETTDIDRVPDLRGMFLRGLNEFEGGKVRNDGLEDPDGATRKPGNYQEDRIKKHRHLVASRTADTSIGGTKLPYRGGGSSREWWSEENTDGSSETRPRNVAIYYFIKIN